ncbi:MAG: type II toxin-antitoxin system RelE/ParE family toxin [candidate division NC10 bacterium]|nr:type II toxin-antitoxin system RelE/ParE family toxin [candidate division NC10 bacterium]
MAGKRLAPLFTENFAGNLDGIRTFLGDEGRAAFDRLLDGIVADLVPTLCQFPRSGRAFLAHPIRSLEARTAIRRVKRSLQPGDNLREFVVGEYILLYLIRGPQIIFLSIKHHRQLSFDLDHFWP